MHAHCDHIGILAFMGNLLSVNRVGYDGRIHICSRCGWSTPNRTALRVHLAYQCRIQSDGRWKRGSRTVTLSAQPAGQQSSHDHHHEGCSGCEDQEPGQWDDEDLLAAINEQLQQLQEETGEQLCTEATAALADLLVGIMGNDAQDPNMGPSDDDLADLRELLGVAEDPALDTADMDEAPDPESQQELQRLLANIDSPVSAGSDYSVLQMSIIQLYLKRKHRWTDASFNEQCALNHSSRGPGNFYPRSLWLMKKIASVAEAHSIQVPVCVNDCLLFPQLDSAEMYREKVMECCECCGQRVFDVKVAADGVTRIIPRKVLYWFGVGNTIKNRMFTDPSFCKHRTTGRDQYFYPSAEAQRLAEASGCDITRLDVSCYEVGVDWAQVFTSKVHSTGFVMLRCADMPLSHLNRRRFCHIVGIIPGPKEPCSVDPYLEKLLAEFKQYGPQGEGLDVTEYRMGADNKVEKGATFKHTILLSGVFGDSPAIKKLAHWLSHAAYLGCGYCTLRGTVGEGGKGMYFPGYVNGTSFGVFRPQEVQRYGAHSEFRQGVAEPGAEEVTLSHKQQCDRAQAVDTQQALPTDLGCHGTSPFVKQLEYVDYNNLFVVPIAHAGLLGVVKDFWCHVLKVGSKKKKNKRNRQQQQQQEWYVISAEARKVLQARAVGLVATCDFGRLYTDIVSVKGNWTMEDWLHWTESWSVCMLRPYVLDGVTKRILHPWAAEMWQHLRAGLLYFCRSFPVEAVAQDADAATAELHQYAKLVEQRFGLNMCKYNLHLLVCRIAQQESARGRAAHSTEYWLENLIQWAKSTVRYRTTKYPELVLAGDILLDDAIAQCAAQHDAVRQKLAEWEHVDVLGSTYSNPDDGDSDGSQLLGRGRELRGSERVNLGVDAAVEEYILNFQPMGWTTDLLARSSGMLYASAQAEGGELLHSMRYTRARSRVSYNVLCQFWEGEHGEGSDGDEEEVPTYYIGRIKYFVRVDPPVVHPDASGFDHAGDGGAAQSPVASLRLAVMDLHLLQRMDTAVGVVYQSVTYCCGSAAYTNSALSLSCGENDVGSIISKPVLARDSNVAYFVPYANMSASGEAD